MFLVERENDLQADFALDTRPIKVSYSAAAGTAYVSASSSPHLAQQAKQPLAGFRVVRLSSSSWLQVTMDEVVVPPENLIGTPGQGFYQPKRWGTSTSSAGR